MLDAGLIREKLARKMAQGGDYREGVRLAKLLVRLTRLSYDTIWNNARSDASLMVG